MLNVFCSCPNGTPHSFANADIPKLRMCIAHISPERIVNDDGATIRQSFDRVAHIAGHNPHHARSSNLLDAVDGQFEFAFDPDLRVARRKQPDSLR